MLIKSRVASFEQLTTSDLIINLKLLLIKEPETFLIGHDYYKQTLNVKSNGWCRFWALTLQLESDEDKYINVKIKMTAAF